MDLTITPQTLSVVIGLLAVAGLMAANWDRLSALASRLRPRPADQLPVTDNEQSPAARLLDLMDLLVQENGRLQLGCEAELKAMYGRVIDRLKQPDGERQDAGGTA